MPTPRSQFHVAPQWQPVFREIGIDGDAIFTHPGIKPWRSLRDRENCTLDATLESGRRVRLHIKRFPAAHDTSGKELAGQQTLIAAQIPTLDVVAYGKLEDGRGFIISDDLSGYEASDKLIKCPADFDRLLISTADLAAKLHRSGLHHRDLYLCHFFAKVTADDVDVKLIDTARVKRLPGVLTRRRWIVKDLAQFWYSTLALPIDAKQRDAWLARYAASSGIELTPRLQSAILRKTKWIARHDRKLVKDQPNRNISIPGS
jgi:hypothetical protein